MSIASPDPGREPGHKPIRAALWLAAAVLAIAPVTSSMAEDRALPESNLALLDRSLDLVAEELLNRAALPSGTRLLVATEGERPIDADMEKAFLHILTGRGFEAWTLSARPAPVPKGEAAASPAGTTLPPDFQAAQEAGMRSLDLEPAGADSSVADGGAEEGAQAQQNWLDGVADHLPVLVFEVEEARVDYPRMYRSGVFGGQHVERRAMARVSARILRAESRAVSWVGVADTSLSDVVPRSDLKFLEDKTRAETRGTVPTSDWTKIAEPALVVGLVVGLVALFYSNRP